MTADAHPRLHGADGHRPAPRPPATPHDQAWIESFFGHIKSEWPHLETITDPPLLDVELARVRMEYNTVRLHEAIGYVTPDDEHTAAARPSAKPAATG